MYYASSSIYKYFDVMLLIGASYQAKDLEHPLACSMRATLMREFSKRAA